VRDPEPVQLDLLADEIADDMTFGEWVSTLPTDPEGAPRITALSPPDPSAVRNSPPDHVEVA
jgi:hypothetical protein